MKLNVEYFDNEILLSDGKVFVLEIENKKYFYKFIMDILGVANGDFIEGIKFFDNEFKEVNIGNKLSVIIDYFNFEVNLKKYNNILSKYIISCICEKDKIEIMKISSKLMIYFNKLLNSIDLPLSIHLDNNIENIVKLLKINVDSKNEILDNILLLIDLEKTLKLNKIIIFVNLKQYLSKKELEELYKYSLYNQIKIVLVDSQSYGVTGEYETKLIIDDNLDEFML